MADYKLEFEPDVNKTYCDATKVTNFKFGFPWIFWLVQFIQLLIAFLPVFSWSFYFGTVLIQVLVVRFCIKRQITIFDLVPYLIRKKTNVYYPVVRRDRHTRDNIYKNI